MSRATPVASLVVDLRTLDHPTARDRGIGRYTAGLWGGLNRIGAPAIGLCSGEADAQRARAAGPELELRPWGPAAFRDGVGSSTWYLATQLMLHPVALDPLPSVVTGFGLPVAAVMYDVIPYRYPELYQRDPHARALAQVRAPLARTVDAMLAISDFAASTAADELRFPRDRMRVIGAGVDDRFVPAAVRELPWPERVLSADVRPFVVAVTGADERKNTDGLLRAWSRIDAELRQGTRLVVATAAPAPVLRAWRELAAELGVTGEVEFTDHVSDDEMVALLQRARLAVLPSLEEGFGLPVLEAAACGCPAICSGTSSLPEVLDEPAGWFDPADPGSIAAAIERGLRDEDHRAVLAAAGRRAVERFTWDRVAADTLAALDELGPRWPRRPAEPPMRVAVVGELGAPSGGESDPDIVAALRALPGAPRVDVLVDRSGRPEPTGAGAERFPARALGRYLKPWDYDHVVAVLDGTGAPGATARAMQTTPCHLWLRAGAPDGLGELIASARSVIVVDDAAARAVRERHPDGPPVFVLPGGASEGRASALFGWLEEIDRP